MSGKDPVPNPQAYEGLKIVIPTGGFYVIKARRAPTSNDKKYPITSIWVDTVANASYQLTGIVANTPNWQVLASPTGAVGTLTGDTGTATPSSGNIQIAGTANQITTSATGAIVTVSLPSAITAPGSVTATTTLTATLGAITATNGNLVLSTAGNKLSIATGANASVGTSVAMTAGTVTISTTAVTASSKIFLTANTPGGTQGTLSAPTASIVAGTSFVINSSSNTDTSTVNWWIVN